MSLIVKYFTGPGHYSCWLCYWPCVAKSFRTRISIGARRFWASTVAGRLEIVVSRFRLDEFSEPTGIIGGGDAPALPDLKSFPATMGVKKFDVTYVDEPGLNRENNLILLGGPGSNKVTRDAFHLVRSRLQIIDPGPGNPCEIRDLLPPPGVHMASTGVAPTPRHLLPVQTPTAA
jgi:hypothetical protein